MKPYYYKAKVVSVYDGDTCTCVIDLGFKLSVRVKVRLLGIDTPEVRTRDKEEKAKGLSTRDWLRERILDKDVLPAPEGEDKTNIKPFRFISLSFNSINSHRILKK